MKATEGNSIELIPIFPLACVVFPGEELQLHIYEERYKSMVNECLARADQPAKPFGITCVFEDTPAKVGCTVIVEKVLELYEDGRMDIKTLGIKRFEVQDIIRDKLYPQAAVNYIDDYTEDTHADNSTNAKVALELQKKLLELVPSDQRDLPEVGTKNFSFRLAHHAGLALEQRQAYLEMRREKERLEFLIEHYERVIPVIEQEETIKRLIRLNGNLRKLKAAEL